MCFPTDLFTHDTCPAQIVLQKFWPTFSLKWRHPLASARGNAVVFVHHYILTNLPLLYRQENHAIATLSHDAFWSVPGAVANLALHQESAHRLCHGKSMQETSCSGVISASNFHNGFPSTFAQIPHRIDHCSGGQVDNSFLRFYPAQLTITCNSSPEATAYRWSTTPEPVR